LVNWSHSFDAPPLNKLDCETRPARQHLRFLIATSQCKSKELAPLFELAMAQSSTTSFVDFGFLAPCNCLIIYKCCIG